MTPSRSPLAKENASPESLSITTIQPTSHSFLIRHMVIPLCADHILIKFTQQPTYRQTEAFQNLTISDILRKFALQNSPHILNGNR